MSSVLSNGRKISQEMQIVVVVSGVLLILIQCQSHRALQGSLKNKVTEPLAQVFCISLGNRHTKGRDGTLWKEMSSRTEARI